MLVTDLYMHQPLCRRVYRVQMYYFCDTEPARFFLAKHFKRPAKTCVFFKYYVAVLHRDPISHATCLNTEHCVLNIGKRPTLNLHR